MKQKCCLNHAMQEGLFLLLLGGGLLAYALDAHSSSLHKDWLQSPSLFPCAVSCLLAALGAAIFLQGLRRRDGEDGAGAGHAGHTRRVLAVLGMSLAYVLALGVIRLPYLGVTVFSLTLTVSVFEAATAVFLLAMLLYLGVRSKRMLVLVPVGVPALLSVLFRTLLRVLLP